MKKLLLLAVAVSMLVPAGLSFGSELMIGTPDVTTEGIFRLRAPAAGAVFKLQSNGMQFFRPNGDIFFDLMTANKRYLFRTSTTPNARNRTPLILKSNGDLIVPSGRIGIGTQNPGTALDVRGLGKVEILEITGGSDLSETFNVLASVGAVLPGMVVSIDPTRAGQLRVSGQAYDRTVAGIISGAGDLKTGMLMGQQGSIANGEHPVALTGRVYCYVDASFGAIQPGDLLTTSPTPGHAMKVTDFTQAQGAILGKAMTGLSDGKGLVLVLVSLQ